MNVEIHAGLAIQGCVTAALLIGMAFGTFTWTDNGHNVPNWYKYCIAGLILFTSLSLIGAGWSLALGK